MVYIWKSENNLHEMVLFFYHAGSREQTQVIMIVSKHLYLLSHPAGLIFFTLKKKITIF